MKTLRKSRKGAALVEYGILVGLIAVLAIVAVFNLGGMARNTFATVSSQVSQANASAQDMANNRGGNPSNTGETEDLTMNFTLVPGDFFDRNGTLIAIGYSESFGSISGDLETSHGRLVEVHYDVRSNRTFLYLGDGENSHIRNATLICAGTTISLINGNLYSLAGNPAGFTAGVPVSCTLTVDTWESGGGLS